MQDVQGKRVTVVGLGIEGVDLVRYFAARGAIVTVSDAKSRAGLAPQLAAIEPYDVILSLGSNRDEAVAGADLVAVTQGAPLDLPPIREARRRGIPVTSLTQLFLERCRGTVAGISGSSGKTTTTSMTGAILSASGLPTIVGGNIGQPLLSRVDTIQPSDWVVLEVSHSQLVLTTRSPRVSCLTNVTPNHLDRFTWDEYVALKRNLIAHQHTGDIAVLNRDDEVTRTLANATAATVHWFGLSGPPPDDGAYLVDETIVLRRQGRDEPVMSAADLPLRGRHNLANAVCACAIAGACGVDVATIAHALRGFHAVPHRLESVARVAGAAYYDDSIATSPERTLAGMRSFAEPLVLLLGGREKHLPLEELAREAARRCRAVICFGEARELLARACIQAHPRGVCAPLVRQTPSLAEAVSEAARLAHAGDVVLLSPACTSFDAFANFEQRGNAFRDLARALPGATAIEETVHTSAPERGTKEERPSLHD